MTPMGKVKRTREFGDIAIDLQCALEEINGLKKVMLAISLAETEDADLFAYLGDHLHDHWRAAYRALNEMVGRPIDYLP
jgi:hypothetical protein